MALKVLKIQRNHTIEASSSADEHDQCACLSTTNTDTQMSNEMASADGSTLERATNVKL